MSSFPVQRAEAVTLLIAKETTLGTQPTVAWQTLQPNPDGIGEYYPHIKTVAPAPLSKFRQMEAPVIVDLDATPKLTHDLTKDLMDQIGQGLLLALAKHPGGTGVAYFTNQAATPMVTARTTTAYTVNAGGALQAGTLVVPRGWVTGANATANGTLQVVGAASGATSITVAGGVAETPAGAYTVTLEVAGFRGAAGDIQLDATGDLISTAADFTTMGLTVGQWIWVGGAIGSAFTFATAAYRGFAKIKGPITATKIPLTRRQWTVGAADTGATKTIDLYWGRWLRNVAFDSADYLEQSFHMELSYPKLLSGTTDEFVYSAGNLCDQWTINIPGQNLVTIDLSFIGTTIGDPTTTRATGASTAGGLLAIDRYNTVTGTPYVKLSKQSDDSVVSNDIDNLKLTVMNHITPQKQIGTLGTARDVVGKIEVSADIMAYLTQPDAILACSANTTLQLGVGLRNTDGGIFFDVPSVKCTDAPPKFPGNGPVSLDLKSAGFRDATLNITLGVTLFPFLPTV